ETSKSLLRSFKRVRRKNIQSSSQVEESNRRTTRTPRNTMHHHLQTTGPHLINEIQNLVNHHLLNEQRNRQIKQAHHYPVSPACNKALRMALRNTPQPVTYRPTMIRLLTSMHYSPTRLTRNNGFIVDHAAHK